MTLPRSAPDRVGRLLAGFARQLARQLDLPLFGGSTPAAGDKANKTDASGRRTRPPMSSPGTVPPSVDPELRRVRLGERTLDYALRRARRKTIGFSIGVGGLTVAAPRWVGIGQVEAAIREREAWVLTKLADMRRHHASIPQVRWEDGGTVPYLGAPLTLRIGPATEPRGTRRQWGVIHDAAGRSLTLALPPASTPTQVREGVESWLRTEARALFVERLAFYEARLGVAHRQLRLSSAKTRWGSCSADGRILLNWRLIHFPLSSIDYVVAHELSHLKEMNHGPRFWATVATICPDYEAARDLVKKPPPELLPNL